MGIDKAAMLLAGLTVIAGLSNGTSLIHRTTKAVLLLIHTYIPIHTYVLVRLYVSYHVVCSETTTKIIMILRIT